MKLSKQSPGWWIPGHPRQMRCPVEWQNGKDVAVIAEALKYFDGRTLVIQAGGRVGLWPITMAAHFKHVVTIEADQQNFACIEKNIETRGIGNVETIHAVLGPNVGETTFSYSALSDGHHFVPDGPPRMEISREIVRQVTVDSLELSACDAIFLDIEGYELQAIAGATDTISRFRPIVVAEENHDIKRFGRRPGDLAIAMAKLGYELKKVYNRDLIFVPA